MNREVTLIVLAVSFMMMFTIVKVPNAAAQDDYVEADYLSSNNNILYFKAEGDGETGGGWLDANIDMNGSSPSHGPDTYVGSGTFSEDYAQDPVVDRTLYIDHDGGLAFEFHMDRNHNGFRDAAVQFRVSVGSTILIDEPIQEDNSYFRWSGNISEDFEKIEPDDQWLVHWEYTWDGSGSYTVYTDGTSFISVPLVKDNDGDGIPDDRDDDDDNDGYTDEEEIAAGTDPLNALSFPAGGGGGGSSSDDDLLPGFESLLVLAAVPVALIGFKRRH